MLPLYLVPISASDKAKGLNVMSDGLTDHDLLMEVRKDVKWIKSHPSQVPSRKEIYSVIGLLFTIFGIFIAISS